MILYKVEVEGLREFRAALKGIDREFGKALRQAHLKIARDLEKRSRAAAPTRAQKGIKAKATQSEAAIRVTPGRRGDALGVLLGMRRRSGWYARPRYRQSRGRQFDPWVGNKWDPGERAGKPYFIGDAINEAVPDAVDTVGDEYLSLFRQAFPH